MSSIQTHETVGAIVARHPSLARVFEAHRIDYCCGGKISLADACARARVDVARVIAELNDCLQRDDADSISWSTRSLSELADHIVGTHHAYLRDALPRLAGLIEMVVRAHGERHRELAEVLDVFRALQQELTMHMQKEEVILFPLVKRMEESGQAVTHHCGSVANPIGVMEDEHDFAGQALETLRGLTRDHQPPADACNTYRVMLDGLAELERDLHAHIHKENNILFPRAIALEAELPCDLNPAV